MIVTASVARYFNWGCLCWIRRRNKVKSNKNIVCWQIVYTRKVRYEVHRQLPTSSEKLWCLAFENQWFVFLFVTWCDLRPCFRWTHLTSDPSGLCHVIIHHRITLSKVKTKELVAVFASPPTMIAAIICLQMRPWWRHYPRHSKAADVSSVTLHSRRSRRSRATLCFVLWSYTTTCASSPYTRGPLFLVRAIIVLK